MTELENERAFAIGAVGAHHRCGAIEIDGEGFFTTVPLSMACNPPATTTLPGAYIAHAALFGIMRPGNAGPCGSHCEPVPVG
jgi:hypothetical protein